MASVEIAEEVERINPFDLSDLERLEDSERKLDVLDVIIQKAERCGIACANKKQMALQAKQAIAAIKSEFLQGLIDGRNTTT